MNKPAWKMINIIATGFVVTVLFSLVLFWGRLFCNVQLTEVMPWESKTITISPSGFVPGEGQAQLQKPVRVSSSTEAGVSNEPNTRLSAIQSNMENYFAKSEAIGISQPSIRAKLSNATIQFHNKEGFYLWYQDNNNYMHFNKRNGLIALRDEYTTKSPSGEQIIYKSEFYAGPNGVSRTASASLGRFEEPIAAMGPLRFGMGLYDKKQRRFYLVDFEGGKVVKGLELAQEDRREPVAMGQIDKGFGVLLSWTPPKIKDVNDKWNTQKLFLSDSDEPNEGWNYHGWIDYTQKHIIVLDKSGMIYKLDTVNWSLADAGFLPVPLSFFSTKKKNEIACPEELPDYDVLPIYIFSGSENEKPRLWQAKDRKYLGMCVSSLSREGTALTTVIFDSNGTQISRVDTKGNGWASDASLFGTILFLIENLQPPVFEVASYLSGNGIEASAGHRGLFILPNSFVGMLGGSGDGKFLERQILALVLMGPSLVLSVWLAWRIRKDAKLTGLSSRATTLWTVGTFAFGLPAYITYRLTRPKEALVTCQNCGNMRRPDMERCHRCGSKWEVPELAPPNWRICD